MSYADSILDLAGVNVACMAGSNGAGKSALLDALTWALWEKARTNTSDDLIRLSEKEMWVDLLFEHEGRQYRVRRSRQKSFGKGGSKSTSKGALEFQVRMGHEPALVASGSGASSSGATSSGATSSGATIISASGSATSSAVISGEFNIKSGNFGEGGGSWRSLTGGSVKDTQKTINDLLRMDFDTFVNSAYLRQGKADEFTTRKAQERKQVLSEILGLTYFDQLQEKAKDKAKQAKFRAQALEGSMSGLKDVEAEAIRIGDEKKIADESLAISRTALTEAETKFGNLNRDYQELLLAEQHKRVTEKHIVSLQEDIEQTIKREVELDSRLKELDELLAKSPEIESAALEFAMVEEAIQQFEQKLSLTQDLATKRIELQGQLSRQRATLEVELNHTRETFTKQQTQLERLRKELLESTKTETAYTAYKALVAQEIDLSKKQEAFVQLTTRAHELENIISNIKIRMEADLGQKELTLQQTRELLGTKDSLVEQKTFLTEQTTSLDKYETEFDMVSDRGIAIKSLMESVELKIEDRRKAQTTNLEKITELKAHEHSSICPLCSAPIVDRAAVIEKYLTDNEASENDISGLRNDAARLEVERGDLRKRYAELKKHLDGRQKLDVEIGKYNERLEVMKRAEEQVNKLSTEIESIQLQLSKQDYAQVERESLIGVKAESYKLDFDPHIFSNVQSQLRMQRHVEAQYQQMLKNRNEATKIESELPSIETKQIELTDQLTSESYGTDVRESLQKLNKDFDAINYDKGAHTDSKERRIALAPKLELHKEIQRALAERPKTQESLTQCQGILASKRKQIDDLQGELVAFASKAGLADELKNQVENQRLEIDQLRHEREQRLQEVAILSAQLLKLEGELAAVATQKDQLEKLYAEAEDFTVLAEAFGKKGIQAVIIENAIPEIETEANRILSRVTDNKMHIGLVTQHKTQTGTMQEVLDLFIADEIGTRSYELYSGGEAFKVNFAVRVALSKLLARRSGAKLETLIIDEGFGSQDDSSREKLVKAIKSIQSDFAKILVITHVADVRELFPTQIQVSKINGISKLQIAF